MRKKSIFLMLAVLMTAVFLTGCQESILDDPQMELTDGLFLKSAQEGEEASTLYIDGNSGGTFYFPDNILFNVEGGIADVINRFLVVEDYHIFDNKQEAVFRVKNPGENPIFMGNINGQDMYSPHTENVSAVKLPIDKTDIGSQGTEGENRFNGLLKADYYVLAVNERKITVFNLDSQERYSVIGDYDGDGFFFSVQDQTWQLSFVKTSPIGNVFTLNTPFGEFIVYTLMR